MSSRSKVIEAIRDFDFSEYGMDEVDEIKDFGEWVEHLADAVLDAIDAQPFHTIDLRADSWVIKHPLDCRDNLFGCPYNNATAELDGPPLTGPGIYRCTLERGQLLIEERVND